MSPTLTKQFVASSVALRSEEGNEVSLDILTYSCCCLKIHSSVANANFGILVMSRIWTWVLGGCDQ